MKIAIQISSIQNNNKFRGIGFYTKNLISNLKKLENHSPIGEFELITFSDQIPQADLFHFPAFNPFQFSIPPKLIKKSIITIHDLIPLEYPRYFPTGIKADIIWQIQKHILKFSRHIITDSVFSQKSITKHTNISQKNITPIYLSADSAFKPISDKFKLEKIAKRFYLPNKFILYVGDHNWNKNVVLLAKTCIDLKLPLIAIGKQAVNNKIDKVHPWNQELVEFQKLSRENKELIKCLGFVETSDLVAIYNLATCFVCPSIAEGFGLPLLEAMSCGCPTLSSSKTSLPEIYGNSVLTFNPFSKKQLEENLKKIWLNSKLRKSLSQKEVNQAQKFNWTKTAKETLEIYSKYK